ncbi:hypothetical protein DEIPH_ctg075orf0006 [Deinococcus phoenicis]|uniref:Uncharacterized protein n=1 Tax=Deinococcus phoenicis TaxID=1476583 RepID=A0A016QLV6_9DEIO|nr:hypothetical protein DEIPH_ctg075orf0006 [Deinococcus phoenicis]
MSQGLGLLLAGALAAGLALLSLSLLASLWPYLPHLEWPDDTALTVAAFEALLLGTGVCGAGLSFSLWAWLRALPQRAAGARRVFSGFAWALRLLLLGSLLAFFVERGLNWASPGPWHNLQPGVYSAFTGLFALLLVAPLVALVWSALGRWVRWMGAATAQVPQASQATQMAQAPRTPSLHSLYRGASGPLRALAAVLLGLGLFLLPVQMVTRAPSEKILSTVEQVLAAHGVLLMPAVMLGSLAAGGALWLWASLGEQVTHLLDPQRGRISELWQRVTGR